jgi:hypothetical protein
MDIFSTKRKQIMAKWDSKKLDKDMKEAEKNGDEPPVPVPTPSPKMSHEEKLRRYDRG